MSDYLVDGDGDLIAERVAPYEVDGWVASRDAFSAHGSYGIEDGGNVVGCNVNFIRWVK